MHIEMLTGRGTIDDFYGQRGYLEAVQRYPSQLAMGLLIDLPRSSEAPFSAYGMTHHHELGLRAVDDLRAQEYVSIIEVDEHSLTHGCKVTQPPWRRRRRWH